MIRTGAGDLRGGLLFKVLRFYSASYGCRVALNLPWLPDEPDHVGDLIVSRGRDDVLTYDDGISLRVVVLDPSSHASAEELLASARAADEPGWVALVAGSVPVEWRAALRHAEVSFIDVGGVAWIVWPRLRAGLWTK